MSRWRDSVQRPASNFNSCISSSYCCTDTDCAGPRGRHVPDAGPVLPVRQRPEGVHLHQELHPADELLHGGGRVLRRSARQELRRGDGAGRALSGRLGDRARGSSRRPAKRTGSTVTFNNESNTAFHGHVVFSANPNNEFVFDLATDCKGTLRACGEGGLCQGEDGMGGALHGGRSHRADLGAHLGRDRVHPRLPAERRSTHLRSVGAHDQRVTG